MCKDLVLEKNCFIIAMFILHILAADFRQLKIAAIACSYNITINGIVHYNNFMLSDMFWQKFRRLLGRS